jgi:aminoglycoside 6'-N-acetyltransferase
MLFQEREIGLRYLVQEDELLLSKWLTDEKVLEFYEGRDRPHDLKLVRKHFFEDRECITQCIIQYDQRDIGYIQFYPITNEEKEIYGYIEDSDVIYGMDQFIGEVEYWNKGIGSKLVGATVDYILREIKANKIVMDPQAWNTRAIRCYEKCGFIKKKYLEKHEYHEGQYRDCWLIEYCNK